MSRSLYARLAERFGDRRHIMTRRDAMRASAAGLAGLLALTRLSGCATTRSNERHGGRPARRPNGRSVIVVGAGFAGLACAYELLEFGYDVQIVEARPRVGGRVLSFRDFVPGKVVEGGAELIGSNHLTWQAYAQQFGLRMLDVTSEEDLDFPIRLAGRSIDAAEAERLWIAMDQALSGMNALAAPVSADEPWTSPGAADTDQRTVADWIDGLSADSTTKQVLRIIMSSDNACPVERQSLLGMLAQVAGGGGQSYWEDSEVYRCRGGNQQLADKLAEAIGSFRFLLNAPVRAIQYGQDGDRATVSTTTGQALVADEVVLTTPPSTWGSIFFDPALPGDMSGTFAPQMGTAVKYLSHVKSRYWRDLGLAPDSLSDGPVAMTWEGTDNQRGRPASLHVFAGGPAADELRLGTRADVDARVRRELEATYPGYVQNLARGGSGGDTRFMDWPAEPFTAAGYSFPAPGQLTRLGQRIHDGLERLRFAGEHASPAFVGYMEGGLRSGVMLAQRMALRDGAIHMPEPAAGTA